MLQKFWIQLLRPDPYSTFSKKIRIRIRNSVSKARETMEFCTISAQLWHNTIWYDRGAGVYIVHFYQPPNPIFKIHFFPSVHNCRGRRPPRPQRNCLTFIPFFMQFAPFSLPYFCLHFDLFPPTAIPQHYSFWIIYTPVYGESVTVPSLI